uniref:Uncharacterized protein n=1 Tax=Leersia perrieri TaxID=77586 RepID=A0A0D9VV95_9ORYZ
MQRRRQHGSSGELDVFGATLYFAGLATARPIAVVVKEPEDLIITKPIKTTTSSSDNKTEEISHHDEMAGAIKTRSKLAAFLSSLVSPESTSFRKKPPPASREATTAQAGPPKLSTSTSNNSRPSIDAVAASSADGDHRDDDLGGVAMLWEDRRLQGVRIVRCGGCDEERWVVRCGAWEEHYHHGQEEKIIAMVGAATSTARYGSQVNGEQEVVGDGSGWESDSSSDLFELDLESA